MESNETLAFGRSKCSYTLHDVNFSKLAAFASQHFQMGQTVKTSRGGKVQQEIQDVCVRRPDKYLPPRVF